MEGFLALLGKIAALAPFLALFYYLFFKRRRRLASIYDIACKSSKRIVPPDIMGIRAEKEEGFKEKYYFHRENVDVALMTRLSENKSVLITGDSLAGKTRAVYQALVSLRPPALVTVPKLAISTERELFLPWFLDRDIRDVFCGRRNIVFFDDIEQFLEGMEISGHIRELKKKGIIIVATCRTGPELEAAKERIGADFAIFGKPVEISRLSEEEEKNVLSESGFSKTESYDRNIGSLFLPLSKMKDRFDKLTPLQKGVLRAAARLFISGVFEAKDSLSIEKIKRLAGAKEGIRKEKYEWEEIFKELEEKRFLEMRGGAARTEQAYMERIAAERMDLLDVIEEVKEVFKDDPRSLFMIGSRAFSAGLTDKKRADFFKKAIEAYNEALKVYNIKDLPVVYAATMNNLGNAYGRFAEVQDTKGNCRKAIEAYNEALKVYNIKDLPVVYAATMNNLGNAYGTLAKVEDRKGNCRKAIEAYNEALKVYNIKDFPVEYAGAMHNLGNAYRMLAEVEDKKEDKKENCRKAIDAFSEALKVRTLKDLPVEYVATMNNLGSAYGVLAEVEDREGNCRKAIDAFKEALKVYNIKDFPVDYTATMHNLGNAYRMLAEVEDREGNCRKAIDAFKEALKVRTLKDFPMNYAMTMNSLGNAYGTLAKVEDTKGICRKAIEAYNEALKVYNIKDFPFEYAATMNNLGIAYEVLAEVEDKEGNCRKAIEAYNEALKVYNKKDFPEIYKITVSNLEIAKKFCGGQAD